MALLTTVLLMLAVSSFFCLSDVTGGHSSSTDDDVHRLLLAEGDSNVGRLVRSVMQHNPYHHHHHHLPTTTHESRGPRSVHTDDEGTTASTSMTEEEMMIKDELTELASMITPLFDHYLPGHRYSLPPTNDDLMRLKHAVWKREQQEGNQQKDMVINLLNSA